MRAALRFAGAVLAVTGVMLVTDAGLTLAWQEPISALLAARQQSRLEDELTRVERRSRLPDPPVGSAERRDVRRLAARYRRSLREGRALGRIEMPTLDGRFVMVEGTDSATLRKGPGHYPDTGMPGEGRTVAVAGHRTTFLAPFRTIDRLRRRDRIVLRVPYGRFVYRVERTRIVDPIDTWVVKDVGYERLVLTACHPLYSARQRIVVFARLAAGPGE